MVDPNILIRLQKNETQSVQMSVSDTVVESEGKTILVSATGPSSDIKLQKFEYSNGKWLDRGFAIIEAHDAIQQESSSLAYATAIEQLGF